jgi:hypothetical protein
MNAEVGTTSIRRLQTSLRQRPVRELGGELVVSKSSGRLVIRSEVNGHTRSISIDTADVNFHTHPGTCKGGEGASKCAIGVPSSSDMAEILRRAFGGNRSHVVASHDGVYVVQVKPTYVRALLDEAYNTSKPSEQKHWNTLTADGRFSTTPPTLNRSVEAHAKRIYNEFDALEEWFYKNFENTTYRSFRKKWLQYARKRDSPFSVKVYNYAARGKGTTHPVRVRYAHLRLPLSNYHA